MYKMKSLQNASDWDTKKKPTIVIHVNDPEWDEAYKNWSEGKPPTDSPLWGKNDIFLTYQKEE